MKQLVLASGSPRRKEILTKHGVNFTTAISGFPEIEGEFSPEIVAMKNAEGKAEEVYEKAHDKSGIIVLAADTLVVLNGEIFGKPKDKEQAKKFLLRLSGNRHSVITGYAVIAEGEKTVSYVKTDVIFNDLPEDLIETYINIKNPLDKAGAYGIQDGFGLVKEYIGSYENILGLPIEEILPVIEKYNK